MYVRFSPLRYLSPRDVYGMTSVRRSNGVYSQIREDRDAIKTRKNYPLLSLLTWIRKNNRNSVDSRRALR